MDKENERNARLLESLKMKDERLKKDLEFYEKRTKAKLPERTTEEIWMDGWGACQTVKGLMSLKYDD